MPKTRLWIALIVILFNVSPGKIYAQETHATVRLDGRAIFRVGETEEQDGRTRARQIEQRLAAVLENPKSLAPPRVNRVDGNANRLSITVAGRPVVTVTPVDAEENNTSVEALASQWALAIDAALRRASDRRLSERDRFIVSVQSSIETAFARLLESAIVIIPRALAALLVIAFFWALAAAVRWLMRMLFRWIVSDLTIENLIKQVGYYAVWLLGLLVAASAFGLDPQTVVTGLGLTSLALGFALKDILSNFVSGLLILTLRPFKLGDQIIIGDTEGSVERIELRATLIRTYDGRMVSVPNSETFTSRVTNNTASPVRRGSVELYLGYDADLQRAIQVMLAAAQETEGVLRDPACSIRVRALGQDDIVLEARFWTDSRRSDFLSTASRVRISVVQRFKEQGVGLPDPDVRILMNRRVSKVSDPEP